MRTFSINKRVLHFTAFCFLLFMSVSCMKTDVGSAKIQGLWVGAVGNAVGTQYYALAIKPDGTLFFQGISKGRETYGSGTWELQGSNFKADVTTQCSFANVGVVQRLTATFNSADGTLSNGQYVVTAGGTDNGTFAVTKVQ